MFILINFLIRCDHSDHNHPNCMLFSFWRDAFTDSAAGAPYMIALLGPAAEQRRERVIELQHVPSETKTRGSVRVVPLLQPTPKDREPYQTELIKTKE